MASKKKNTEIENMILEYAYSQQWVVIDRLHGHVRYAASEQGPISKREIEIAVNNLQDAGKMVLDDNRGGNDIWVLSDAEREIVRAKVEKATAADRKERQGRAQELAEIQAKKEQIQADLAALEKEQVEIQQA